MLFNLFSEKNNLLEIKPHKHFNLNKIFTIEKCQELRKYEHKMGENGVLSENSFSFHLPVIVFEDQRYIS